MSKPAVLDLTKFTMTECVRPKTDALQKITCPTDGRNLFHVTSQGIEIKCRQCHGIHLLKWDELIEMYRKLAS